MGDDFVVLAQVSLPEGDRLVLYRMESGRTEFSSGNYRVDRRYVLGFEAKWAVADTRKLLQRAPTGPFGDLYLDEIWDAAFEVRDGIYLIVENEAWRVVGTQAEHWLKKPPAKRDAKLQWLAEAGLRVLHDGEGQIFRIVNAPRPKPRGVTL